MMIVTGATGFVGHAVLTTASDRGLAVRGVSRGRASPSASGLSLVPGPELAADSDWSNALKGAEVVVHAAARVHLMHDLAPDPLAEFRRVNVEGTLGLARQAAAAGARRMVFLSSIKVNGEQTLEGQPFRASDPVAPIDPYGVSKHEAELGLREIARTTGLEIVVIRPVLVYGPGVRANFAAMMRWLRRGAPLPFGSIHNQRSLVALPNLVDLVLTCATHSRAAGGTFLVSDGQDLSTTELLRRLGDALGVRARLLPVSPTVLRVGARLAGREDLARRLLDSLQVDIGPTMATLGWRPQVSIGDALRATATAFLRSTDAHG